jgi:hypothetical protein
MVFKDSPCGTKLPGKALKAIENLPAYRVQLQNYEELQGNLLNHRIEEGRLYLELLVIKRIEVVLGSTQFELKELEKLKGKEIRILNLESRYLVAQVPP